MLLRAGCARSVRYLRDSSCSDAFGDGAPIGWECCSCSRICGSSGQAFPAHGTVELYSESLAMAERRCLRLRRMRSRRENLAPGEAGDKVDEDVRFTPVARGPRQSRISILRRMKGRALAEFCLVLAATALAGAGCASISGPGCCGLLLACAACRK